MKQQYQILTLMLFFVLGSSAAFAQRTISGTVSDSDGQGMPGVNVIVKGTSAGTTSDANGKYNLSVNESGTVILVFSFIGYATQEVDAGTRSSVDVKMAEDIRELSEVVVTALGVERSTKALQYSTTNVGGENFTKARVNNVGNALSGRVAGVNVSNIATGPAGSSRVLIRGNKSLNGQNQPLYVIDGMPMDNSQFGDNNGQAGQWSSQDQGDGLTSINPDDIESITVLKGASATALYGARGGNGVINIVTKKGARKENVNVSFGSNLVFEKVMNLSDLQESYGTGNYVNGVPTSPQTLNDLSNTNFTEQSWGPKLGSGTFLGEDGVVRDYVYAGDNWDRYYETGKTWTNTLAVTGGTENIGLRFSASDLKSDGIVPNSGYDRSNLSLAANAKLKKFSVDAKIMYSHEDVKNRPTVSDSPGNGIQAIWRLPPNVNVDNLRGDPNNLGAIPADADPALLAAYRRSPGQELLPNASNNWGANPWWVAYQHTYSDVKDRVLASGKVRYDITDFLYATGGLSIDKYSRKSRRIYPIGTGDILTGNMEESMFNVQEVNLDWMLGFNKTFDKFSANAFVGGNRMRRYLENVRANVSGFNGGFDEFINNGAGRNFRYDFNQSGINSLFGSAEFGYNNVVFITGTVRNDWFSVLNNEFGNSVLYPSVGMTFVFSDAFSMPSWYSFGKLRASYGEVGVVTIQPYNVANTYSYNSSPQLGVAFASFTRAGGRSGTISNPELVPAKSKELEFGIDTRLFNNRVGIDVTYYSQKTVDDIVQVTFPLTSGYRQREFNIGEITNKGIEVMLSGTPLKNANLTWDVSINFAKNENRVEKLVDGVPFIQGDNSRTQTTQIRHVQGGYYGEIWGTKQRTVDGQPVFRTNGSVRAENSTGYQYLGNSVADGRGGINNSFTYKGINLSFLIDIQVGGELHSGTNDRLTGWGLHKQTLAGRPEEESVVHITGVQENILPGGVLAYEPVDRDLTPDEARQYWGSLGGAAADRFVYDAGFGKLRQVTLGYSLPKSMLSKTPFANVTLSIVARNLAILWKNVDNIDPESVYSSNGNSQGLDYFGMPTTRSMGFDLKLDF